MQYIPYVIDADCRDQVRHDIYSRLLKDRVIFCQGEVNDEMANTIVAQLLYLNAQDPKRDIQLYINSPGGSVTAGMAIIDTMNYIGCDVRTICLGQACSMGALILSFGAKGKRAALPNSTIMIHQPLGGFRGQASDIEIHAKEMLKCKDKLNKMLAENCNKSIKIIAKDTDRDNFMDAKESLEYGIVDAIL